MSNSVCRETVSILESDEGRKWFSSPNPEDNVPRLWSDSGDLTNERSKIYELMAVYALRPDRFTSAAQKFVSEIMGQSFTASPELNLAPIVESEVRSFGFFKLSNRDDIML